MGAREAAEQKLERELRRIRNEAAVDDSDLFLESLDERGIAQELVRQQYTGRYPFELLQNADDASAEVGGDRTVHFELTETALVVADSGSGFRAEHVEAICRLGRSSKSAVESIGHKGLGFKSVGEITDCPQILSGDAWFEFSEVRARSAVEYVAGRSIPSAIRLPVYAFPFPVGPAELGPDADLVAGLFDLGFRTVFRLPLREGVAHERVESDLVESLQPRLLLLLRNTDRLRLAGTSLDFEATVARSATGECEDVLLEVDGDRLERWLVARRSPIVTDRTLLDPLGDAWTEVERLTVAVAAPLDEHGAPCSGPAQPLHTYFPTVERSGFSMILHADFMLELDRRHVARTAETQSVNLWLADELASTVAHVLLPELLARGDNGPSAALAICPVEPEDGFGATVFRKVVDAVRPVAFVPCFDGQVHRPSEVELLPESCPSAERRQDFVDLSGRPVVVDDVGRSAHARSFLLGELGAAQLDPAQVLETLCPPEPARDAAFYEFLVDWAAATTHRTLVDGLREIPFVRVAGGGLRSPASGIFFDRKQGDEALPDDLEVPVIQVPDVEGLDTLLDDVGVKKFEWRPILLEHVLPMLCSDTTADEDRQSAMTALRNYFRVEQSGDPRIQAELGNVLLPCATSAGDRHGLVRADRVYLPASWTGDPGLELLYGPFNEVEFYATSPPSDPDVRADELRLLQRLGAEHRPRILSATTDRTTEWRLDSLHEHPLRHTGSWSEWWASPAVEQARKCPGSHKDRFEQLYRNFALDRFAELVLTHDPVRLAAMWATLARHLHHYEPALTAEFRCQHGQSRVAGQRGAPSLLAHQLTDCAWVPSTLRGATTLSTPRQSWRDSALPQHTSRRVALVSAHLVGDHAGATLASLLGVVDAARPPAGALVALLCDLESETQASESMSNDVHSAARWTVDMLHSALAGAESFDATDVPLPARHRDERVFTRLPYVAADPLLAETWQKVQPVLDAGRELHRADNRMGLVRLDDVVESRPVVQAAGPGVKDRVRGLTESALPYLAALAGHERPSSIESVFPRLKRLDVQACESVDVCYRYDGTEIVREDAVVHLAQRLTQTESGRAMVGTAYVEVGPDGTPFWHELGAQLAGFVGVNNLGDAFGLLLDAEPAARDRFMSSKGIEPEQVSAARERLALPEEEVLTGDVVLPTPMGDATSGHVADRTDHTTPPDTDTADDGRTTEAHPGPEHLAPVTVPTHDLSKVVLTVASLSQPRQTDASSSPKKSSATQTGPVDHDTVNKNNGVIGAAGEKLVYDFERQRLEQRGDDPDLVDWRARRFGYAEYDVESVDEYGSTIYIEVKTTTGDDPSAPFEISAAELRFALQHADRYRIHRVTSILEESPAITVFDDPVEAIRNGSAVLHTSNVRMSFHLSQVDVLDAAETSAGPSGADAEESN